MKEQVPVGIVGIGMYLPEKVMSAKEISLATGGVWSEEAVRDKLGIVQKRIPSDDPCDGTAEMAALAALDCLEQTKTDPLTIDAVIYFGEEWKEYPLTTAACYVQDRVGAKNAWGIDVSNRCCTALSAMKMAKDMLIADDDIRTVLLAGGYRNCDFIDFTDNNVSFMFNLAAGGGAMILQKGYEKNRLLGTHLMSDGCVVYTCGSKVGGQRERVTAENVSEFGMLRLMDAKKMKDFLNTVSMPNWYHCIDEALRKSSLTRADIGYLDILHMKRSGHKAMLAELGLTEEQTVYLEQYGHVGQIDQFLSLKLGLEEGKIREGTVICMIAAGIGYTWAANVIQWG